MRDLDGGGHRPPPKSSTKGGAGDEGGRRRAPPSMHGGADTGRGAVPGGLNLSSDELELELFGSEGQGIHGVDDVNIVDGGMHSSLRRGEGTYALKLTPDARGVSCESGKDTISSVFLGGDAHVGIPVLDTRNLCNAQVTEDDTCMVSHNVEMNDEDACMVSDDGQVNVGNACMASDAAVNVNSSLLPPSASFCMGAVDGFGSVLPNSSAQLSRPKGVCDNVSSKSGQPDKVFGGVFDLSRPCDSKTQAWKKPVVVPLLPVADLGEFSLDGTTAILDEEEVNVTLKRFNHAIVGRMFGRRIPFHLLTSELSRKWGAFGRFRLITLSGDCFVCAFDSMEACEAVLVGGPWVILGQILGIERWSSTFSSSSMDGFRTPVWIRMPNLPLYCWGSKNIARITALIGEPLWIDAATEQIDKGVFARACVRIDLSKPLRPGVWVQGRHGRFFQRMEYEGLSVFCFRCCQVGHKAIACKMSPNFKERNAVDSHPPKNQGAVYVQELPSKSDSVPNSSALDGKDNHHSSGKVIQTAVEQLSVDCEAGPWMMVQRKRRPSKFNQQNNQILHSTHGALNSKASASIMGVRFPRDAYDYNKLDGYNKGIKQDVVHPIFSAGTGTNLSPPQCNSVPNTVSSAAIRKPWDVNTSSSGAVKFCSSNTPIMNKNVQLQDSSQQESCGKKVMEPMPWMSVQNSNKFALLSSSEVGSNVVTVQPNDVMKGISNSSELQEKLAEPHMEEEQLGVTNMEEGQSDDANISAMPKDNKMEKLEDATYVGDRQVNEQLHMEIGMEGRQPIFSGFSALPQGDVGSDVVSVTTKARSQGGKNRGVKKEKMVCELGPVAPGSRKRRKAQSITDGGDASPSPPP